MSEKQAEPKVETITLKGGATIKWSGKGLYKKTVTVVWTKIDTVEEAGEKDTVRYFPRQPKK